MAATGAQIRSILLGVIVFIIVPNIKKTDTTQIPISDIDFNWEKHNSASDSTSIDINANTIIFKTATIRNFGGYLPGYFPPIEAAPQGTPAAKHPWKMITTPVKAVKIMADNVTNISKTLIIQIK